MTTLNFFKQIYNPTTVSPNTTAYRLQENTATPLPDKVAGYIRTVLTVVGTLLPVIGTLEVFGVPILEWINIFSTVCE